MVREVSGGPAGKARAILRTPAGEKFELRARPPLTTNELLRLAKITIEAQVTKLDREGRVATVESYEIVALPDGQRPVVGRLVLAATKAGPRLTFVDADGKALYLPRGWSRKLSRHDGAKVWMLGTLNYGVLRPKRFGILRPVRKKTRPKK